MKKIKLLLLTAFGLGHMRPFSGTWGSTPPVILAGILILLGTPTAIYDGVLLAVLLVFSGVCVAWGGLAEERFGKKDPGQVVADEVAGQCIALMGLPAAAIATTTNAAISLLIAFIAFRIFDIIKPPPANGLQRLKGGWGILIDDLFAGVYALIAVQIVTRVIF